MSEAARVVLLVLDSLDDVLVERGVEEGWLPNLARLIDAGSTVRIKDEQAVVPGSLWATWITGTPYRRHGIVAANVIRPGSYHIDPVVPEMAEVEPFWRHLSNAGVPSTILGLPVALVPDLLGTQVPAWGASTQYAINQGVRSLPPEAAGWLDEVGPRRVTMEGWVDSARDFRRNLDRSVAETRLQARGIRLLMERTDWRFFATPFTQAHQMGHYLWHFHDPTHPRYDPDADPKLRDCMRRTYRELDAAVGSIAEGLGPHTLLLLLSQEGMGPNAILHDPMAGILEAAGHQVRSPGVPGRSGGVRAWSLRTARAAARKTIPSGARARISRRLPTQRWWREIMLTDLDWGRSRAFALPADVSSFVRVNLAGREPAGSVEPGQSYDHLIEQLERDIGSFVDDETGARVVDRIVPLADGGGRPPGGSFPDVIVTWNMRPPFHRLRSPSFGVVEVPQDDVRSGQHRPTGWMTAIGPGVPASGSVGLLGPDRSLLDIAPTVMSALGVPTPSDLEGEPIRWGRD